MIRHLIVTADDYGLCESVNEAIEDCIAAGTVRATCVMANMPVYKTAAALRQKLPQSSIGIHWNLTQGRPVLPSSEVSSLIDGEGLFLRASVLRRRWWRREVKLSELQSELRAQFNRLCNVIGHVDFWNTHQNIHVVPGLFDVFVHLGRELGIPAMRSHRRITMPRRTTELKYNLTHPQYWLKGQIIAWWSCRAELNGTSMPDARLYTPGYDNPATMMDDLMARLSWAKIKNAIEIPIHPATAVRSDLFGTLTESRVAEYQVFKDPRLAERLRRNGVEPVGFEALRH